MVTKMIFGRNTMAEIFFCPNCMANINHAYGICPVCGGSMNAANEPHQLPVNSILNGRYIIGRTLGAGGFGITYVGYDLKLNSKVAVKEYYMSGGVTRTRSLTVVPTDKTNEAPFSKGKERFLDEAKILAQFIGEPNIVNVRDYFEENGTAYIVMEFLDGEDLTHYAKARGRLSFDEVLALLEPAMIALDKVHKKGLIHRDISPSNLMLLRDGRVKVLDFGTARTQSVLGEKSLSIMLKPGYAPEEQYRTHGQQGPWTDVYAMSATFYRLLTGKTPPTSTDRMFEDRIELPSALGVKITPQQEAALMRGLAVRSTDRIQTMEELAKCLTGERRLRKTKKAFPWKKAAAAVLALAVAGGAVYAIVNSGAKAKPAAVTGTSAPKASKAKDSGEPDGEYVLEDKYLLVRETETNSAGIVTSEREYEYDDYGRTKRTVFSYYTEDSSTGERVLSSKHDSYTEFDEDGNWLYHKYVSSYGGNDDNASITENNYEYEFDENGLKTKQYEYDAEHNLVGWTEYEREPIVDSEYECGIGYEYYPDGNLEKFYKAYRVDNNDGFNYYNDWYDANGNMLNRNVSIYDLDGNKIGFQYYDSDGKTLIDEERYTYDAEGRIKSGKRITYYTGEVTEYNLSGEYELMRVYVWHSFDEE